MNTEQKAKAYDEALKRAREWHNDSHITIGLKGNLEDIFPELKESEDERIRKEIIETFKILGDGKIPIDIHYADIFTWLEKQGKETSEKEFTFKAIPRLLDMIEPSDRAKAYCQKLIDTLAKEEYNTDAKIVEGVLKGWNGEDVPMAVMDEKQGEQKDICGKCKKAQPYHSCQDITALGRCYIEGMNTANKDEPKFHEGEWITNGDYTWKIVEVKPLDYILQSQNGSIVDDTISHVDEQFHSFTIKDAKDGDVLLFEGYYNSIVLFQGIGINGKGRINYHCKCNLGDYSFGIQGDVACLGTIEKDAEHYHPATKEQRDLLFQKMKEFGYEWDEENKELKKIEQKPTQEIEPFEAEHGKYYYCIKDYFCGGKKQASKGDVIQALRGLPIMGLKDASEYFLPVSFIKCNSAWSEDDDWIKTKIMKVLLGSETFLTTEETNECVDWLKSLKNKAQPQNIWKPSDDQMKALAWALSIAKNCGEECAFDIRKVCEQLEKLKG